MTNKELDALILDSVIQRYLKVARIIVDVGEKIDPDNYLTMSHEDHDKIAQRIYALVENGQLEAQGDISKWRYSEIRLKQQAKS